MDEFTAIKRYFLNALMPDHVRIGPGDDCAVLSVPHGFELCVSTDTLLEGVHFPKAATPNVIAERSIVANLSDLAAMGATPHGMTLALTLPDLDEAWLGAFSAHAQALAEKYSCPIVGGNLSRGPLSITLTVMGITEGCAALTRSGARNGHGIYVSGHLGAAAGAVAQLQAENPNTVLLKAYQQPVPQLVLGNALVHMASSAIDVSDGLVSDLKHILEASDAGATIVLDDLPMAVDLTNTFGRDAALQLAMHGGDDYQLCFTMGAELHDKVMLLAKDLGVEITKIGVVTQESGVVRSESGQVLEAKGYQHFGVVLPSQVAADSREECK